MGEIFFEEGCSENYLRGGLVESNDRPEINLKTGVMRSSRIFPRESLQILIFAPFFYPETFFERSKNSLPKITADSRVKPRLGKKPPSFPLPIREHRERGDHLIIELWNTFRGQKIRDCSVRRGKGGPSLLAFIQPVATFRSDRSL